MASSGRLHSLETAGPSIETSDEHPKSKACTVYQRASGITSMIFAIVGFVMIVAYVNGSNFSDGYLGGLNFTDLLFNWHPILMIGGFNFCAIYAMVNAKLAITFFDNFITLWYGLLSIGIISNIFLWSLYE